MKSKLLNIAIVLLAIGVLLILYFVFFNPASKFVFEINGSDSIIHNLNDEYHDLGVTIKNGDIDLSNEVIITNNVDPNVEGVYTVTYTYKDQTITRYVTVKKVKVFKLVGDADIYLLLNGTYTDDGIEAVYEEVDYHNEVIITNNIDYTKSGDYKITYTSNKTQEELTRNIHVSEFDDYFKIKYDDKTTVEKLTLNINIDTNKVVKYTLPDGNEKTENATFDITKNDKYTFVIYDKYGNSLAKEVTISNIKTVTEISATCSAVVSNGKTTITVSANKEISKYIYNGVEATKNTYTFDKESTTNKVVLYDNDNQNKEITCTTKVEELGKLEIHFINSGYYDDAILIKSPKATIWIDGGRSADKSVAYLKAKKITTIDYVIGSHTEYDHINAQGEIIKQFNVKNVVYPNDIYNCAGRCDSTDVKQVKSALDSKKIKPKVQSIPSKLTVGDMELYFLAPRELTKNKNNNSFMFILKFGSNTFMFTGDMDMAITHKDYTDLLVSNAKKLGLSNIHSDVLKYPHHGNQTLTAYFIEKVTPKYVVVPNAKTKCSQPSKVRLNFLASYNIKVYSQCSSKTENILITSDGKNITFKMDV